MVPHAGADGLPGRVAEALALKQERGGRMKIRRLEGLFSICRLRDFSQVDWNSAFCFAGKTDEEWSLVCEAEKVPADVLARDDGWRAFRIEGVLDFSMVGVLSQISALLAERGISIFAVSTYNTDYILVREARFQEALEALSDAGHELL